MNGQDAIGWYAQFVDLSAEQPLLQSPEIVAQSGMTTTEVAAAIKARRAEKGESFQVATIGMKLGALVTPWFTGDGALDALQKMEAWIANPPPPVALHTM